TLPGLTLPAERLDELGHRVHGRVGQELRKRDGYPQARLHLRHHPRGAERVTTDAEEVDTGRYPGHAENLRPDLLKLPVQRAGRLDGVVELDTLHSYLGGQPGPVELSAR